MRKTYQLSGIVLFFVVFSIAASAEETVLFNGKDLDGWSYHLQDDKKPVELSDAWVVQKGLLVSTEASKSYLMHKTQFEDYVLTLEWRAKRVKNGVTVGAAGSVYIHAIDEEGAFSAPKSVEISLNNDIGAVYFRDVKSTTESKKWAFRPPKLPKDVEKDLGVWNRLKLISRGKRLTVIVNGVVVNQIDGLNRTKGAIAINSVPGFFKAPTFYRDIRVQPISDTHLKDEKNATQQLAKFKAEIAKKEAAEKAMRSEEKRKQQMKQKQLAKGWVDVNIAQEIDFKADAFHLPFPADAQKLEFDARFKDVSFTSSSSLAKLTRFYQVEMAKRGWKVAEKEIEEDSIEVTFKNGKAEVELSLNERSKGVKVDMDCKGLSFEGSNDPAALAALGIAQPKGHLFLQKEMQLPENIQSLKYDSDDRCTFKSSLELQQAFDFFGQQLRDKGYRETRRPIESNKRRYTEFAKDGIEISVNVFTDAVGSRVILEYDE